MTKGVFKQLLSLPKERGRDAWGLSLIRIFLILSVVVILLISFSGKISETLYLLGLSFTVALASLFCGGIMGFLFGIPKKMQTSTSSTAVTNRFTDNTNLEEISDWLTKIIVGITLVQLPKLEAKFNVLCISLKKSFSQYFDSDFAYTYSGALIIFYFLCGFLAVYLWARTYLMDSLSGQVGYVISTMDKKQKLQGMLKDFQKSVQRLTTAEDNEAYKVIIAKAKPAAATVCNDCQKNRWGGKSEDGFFKIQAEVKKSNSLNMRADVFISIGEVEVGKMTEISRVLYLLHDSYLPDMIRAGKDEAAGKFSCSFQAYEAFTAGVLVELKNGDVLKYEIDLNKLESLPEEFKYTDELMTREQVQAELNNLNAEVGVLP
jgi:hypothetical protein